MNPGAASIRLEEVWKTYRVGGEDVHALAGVSIAFPQGSFWAIMGPSGSGKSTLLNLLGCLDRPSRGACYIQDQPTAGVDDDALSEIRLRHLGFVFQSFNLIAQLSVRENIELPLFYLGWDAERSRRRAEELAALVGLEQRLGHRPSELSGGQQQRVAIARALANDPRIILADEPTGNLDTATGIQIMELLGDLNRRGKTVIMVTHEPEIAAYARHRLHIRDGRIDRIESADG
ncbi:ABC transporter ATP-binding protein [Geoalkalibacter sp.]|uniref:ABC transporter ATP-binding protein n=1 Tax=Geoalkalibacter sp. TaxID=3041440 RepID=UPI00272E0193|nr:ABC transporter ATP-binding protein [Geoalkalibacter sp.]